MEYIACLLMVGGNIVIQQMGSLGNSGVGFTITFPLHGRILEKQATKAIAEAISNNGIDWLKRKGDRWYLESKSFKEHFNFQQGCDWLDGLICVEMEHDITFEYKIDRREDKTNCRFVITPETVSEQLPKKIFLSHKGTDKPTVRLYKSVLQNLGFTPWLDEDAMVAGTELERALLQGFKESCAAVFFVTPNYVDTGYLATEVNYAIQEKRTKGNKFSIITLALPDESGNVGTIPELLKPYVWKTPQHPLSALDEIVRALPIELGSPVWKS